MDKQVSAVTYIGLPISSGGAHSLGRMTRKQAFDQTMRFLAECTNLTMPLAYKFRVFQLKESPTSKIEKHLQNLFGHGCRVGQNLTFDVPRELVPDALEFLENVSPQPVNAYGFASTWFWIEAQFQIIDPATGQALPGQDPSRFSRVEYEPGFALGTSSMHLILENRAKIACEICLPDADTDLLRRIVPWLQSFLPFTFSPTQWREWTPTKLGGFRKRKLTLPR